MRAAAALCLLLPICWAGDDIETRWKAVRDEAKKEFPDWDPIRKLDKVLLDMVRDKDARWQTELAAHANVERNFGILTALRRLEGKPGPVRIVLGAERFECVFPELPRFKVTLEVVDETPVNVQQGGNYRSGRQARWRFEGKGLHSFPVWGMGGGMYSRERMKKGETWSTDLAMASFVEPVPAGTHRVRVLYHDRETIADLDSVADLLCIRSKPFELIVRKRPVRVTHAARRAVEAAIGKLDPKKPRKLIFGTFGPGNANFIKKDSPAGVIMAQGWEAVPVLIESLDEENQAPGRLAWKLVLLCNITQSLYPPEPIDVYGDYAEQTGSGPIESRENGELQGVMASSQSKSSGTGKADPAEQARHVAKWKQFLQSLELTK